MPTPTICPFQQPKQDKALLQSWVLGPSMTTTLSRRSQKCSFSRGSQNSQFFLQTLQEIPVLYLDTPRIPNFLSVQNFQFSLWHSKNSQFSCWTLPEFPMHWLQTIHQHMVKQQRRFAMMWRNYVRWVFWGSIKSERLWVGLQSMWRRMREKESEIDGKPYKHWNSQSCRTCNTHLTAIKST